MSTFNYIKKCTSLVRRREDFSSGCSSSFFALVQWLLLSLLSLLMLMVSNYSYGGIEVKEDELGWYSCQCTNGSANSSGATGVSFKAQSLSGAITSCANWCGEEELFEEDRETFHTKFMIWQNGKIKWPNTQSTGNDNESVSGKYLPQPAKGSGSLTSSSGSSSTSSSTSICVTSPSDILAWYPFDETSGTTAHDIIGGYDGVLDNNPISVTGKVDGALSFSNAQRVVIDSLPADALYYKKGDFSIDFWVDGNSNYIINYEQHSDVIIPLPFNPRWSIGFDSDDGIVFCADAVCYSPDKECSGTDGWNHIALTVDKSGKRIFYINGQQCKTDNFKNEWNHSGSHPTPHLTVDGSSVDELQIFDRVLSPEEIKAIYDADSFGTCGKTLIKGNIWHDHLLPFGEQNTGTPPTGELPLQGITVRYANSTSGILTTQTNANGNYAVPDLTPGRYIIGIVAPTGIEIKKPQTLYYDINLSEGQKLTNLDFGIRLPASISGNIWNDFDCDGNFDTGESGLDDWQVWLQYNSGTDKPKFLELTRSGGNYKFEDLHFPGQYNLYVKPQPNLQQTFPTTPNYQWFGQYYRKLSSNSPVVTKLFKIRSGFN